MKMYVGNMPFSMDEGQLKSLFEAFGEVESVNIITDRDTGRPRGFGFVEMQDADAKSAMADLDDKEIEGRRLKVNEARARENRGGGRNRY